MDAVLVPTSWNSHLPIACDAMRMGKYVGIEVGGAASTEELWQLVHASESTGVSCMMLENCCYGRNELLVLNMVRKGMFGELIHCACGYEHDLSEMACNIEQGHERAIHNLRRNGDLYPTHGLGPSAKILRINRGNRFLSLTSTASKGPSMDWLKVAKTQQAKAKIRQFLKRELRGENVVKGRDMLEREAKRRGVALPALTKPEYYDGILKRYAFSDLEDIYGAVGYGGIPSA